MYQLLIMLICILCLIYYFTFQPVVNLWTKTFISSIDGTIFVKLLFYYFLSADILL